MVSKLLKLFVAVAAVSQVGLANNTGGGAEWPFDVTTISAPDGSITASFASVGASLTELLVDDRDGQKRDVVLGYDDQSKLLTDPAHPFFNNIVGRYANRIKKGRFSLPISRDPPPTGPGVVQIPQNDGQNTLHGGVYGWDRRNWTVIAKTKSSVTYFYLDSGEEGWPGAVAAITTHTVKNGGILHSEILAKATTTTPIMLTQHTYWNLDGFQGADTILDHKLRIDASRVIEVDGTLIPTGNFTDVEGTALDFRTATAIGARWNDTKDLCGAGCQGYDNCWVYDRDISEEPGFSMWSDLSGIKVDMTSSDPAVQFYSGNFINVPRKKAHGGPKLNYTTYSSIVVEQQGYIDAINNPEWEQDQIYYPGKDYKWWATYKFSTVDEDGSV